jgi:dolichyl-diphosphooligosaccharide--protein glycosyltransferase
MINEEWGDNEVTSMTWELISQGKFTDLADLVKKNPNVAHLRSEDGRGPMWWAYEYSRPEVIELLRKLGVSDERTDQNGVRAKDVAAK